MKKQLLANIKLSACVEMEDFEPHTVFDCERNAQIVQRYKADALRKIKETASSLSIQDLKFEEWLSDLSSKIV